MKCELKYMKYSYINLMKTAQFKETLIFTVFGILLCMNIYHFCGTVGLWVSSFIVWTIYLGCSLKDTISYCKNR